MYLQYNIVFKCVHILGKFNVLPDKLSCLQISAPLLRKHSMSASPIAVPQHLLPLNYKGLWIVSFGHHSSQGLGTCIVSLRVATRSGLLWQYLSVTSVFSLQICFGKVFSTVQLWAMCLHWVIFINLVIIQTLLSNFLQQNCWMVFKSNCHQQTKHAGSMGIFCLKWYQMFSSCFPQNMTSYYTVPCFCLLTICICVWVNWCILKIWIMYCSAISWLV